MSGTAVPRNVLSSVLLVNRYDECEGNCNHSASPNHRQLLHAIKRSR